jgi:N-acetylglucosaminyl-diphospho-decaprenol L-rhamnosyltransferase
VRTEVCVVLYDSSDTVGALVESLALLGPGIGLAVHDNGPGARTLPLVAQLAQEAGLAFRGEVCALGNCGFAAGCNALAAASAAQQLLFLNPDARVQRWPEGLTAGRRVVGAVVVDPHGAPSVTYGRQRRLRDEVALRWLRRPPAKPRGEGYVSGAALLVAREQLAALHGFDEGYFMYYEDIDLCHRAMDAGLQVVLDEGFVVEHVGGHSVGKSAAGLRAAHLRSYRSGRRFHERRGHALRGYDAMALVDAAARSALRAPRRSGRALAAADWAVAREALRGLLGRTAARP